MNHVVMYDLNHSKKRLEYYSQLKAQQVAQAAGASAKKSAKETALDKWIEIYSERVRKLERQVTKLGLKTQLSAESVSSAKRA